MPPNALIKKSDKLCESCGFPKVLAIRKGKRPWEFCFNINCEANKALREEWERKKAAREVKAQESAGNESEKSKENKETAKEESKE